MAYSNCITQIFNSGCTHAYRECTWEHRYTVGISICLVCCGNICERNTGVIKYFSVYLTVSSRAQSCLVLLTVWTSHSAVVSCCLWDAVQTQQKWHCIFPRHQFMCLLLSVLSAAALSPVITLHMVTQQQRWYCSCWIRQTWPNNRILQLSRRQIDYACRFKKRYSISLILYLLVLFNLFMDVYQKTKR